MFGLSGAYPVIIQSSGGHGLGPIEETFRALLTASIPTELVVVCGRNEAARKRLAAIRPPGRHRVRVVGFTDCMRELMAVGDLLVTKPGGLTVSEALACGLPMALISPIPGQEVRNADYLLENGAAVKANSPAALTGKIEDLLSSETRLPDMRRKAKTINFGIIYGMGEVTLAKRLAVPRPEASKFIEARRREFFIFGDFDRSRVLRVPASSNHRSGLPGLFLDERRIDRSVSSVERSNP